MSSVNETFPENARNRMDKEAESSLCIFSKELLYQMLLEKHVIQISVWISQVKVDTAEKNPAFLFCDWYNV
jgi:hypothetical protein